MAVASSGSDVPTCGVKLAPPCATLAYALQVAVAAVPAQEAVTVTIAAGRYDSRSCGGHTDRAVLSLVGAGRDTTVVDCGRMARGVFTTGSLVVRSMTFTGGRATMSGRVGSVGGGAVAVVWNTSDVASWRSFVAEDVVFEDNVGVVDARVGGAMPSAYTVAALPGAYGGGAVSVSTAAGTASAGGVFVSFRGCQLHDNGVYSGEERRGDALSGGGAVYVHISGVAAVSNVTVALVDVNGTGNSAGTGGAVYTSVTGNGVVVDVAMRLHTVTMTSNVATDSGGAVAFNVVGNKVESVAFAANALSLHDNSAEGWQGKGGGVQVKIGGNDCSGVNVSLAHVVAINNTAGFDGGGVYATVNGNANVTSSCMGVRDLLAIANAAVTGAGGVSLSVGVAGVDGVFSHVGVSVRDTTCAGNTGAGVSVALGGIGNDVVNVTGVYVNVNVSDNSCPNLGGAGLCTYVSGRDVDSAVLVHDGVTADGNTAEDSVSGFGGGVLAWIDGEGVVSNANVTVMNTVVSGNAVGGNGGGVCARVDGSSVVNSTVTMVNTAAWDNTAGGGAGVAVKVLGTVAIDGLSILVADSTVASNRAVSGDGGGLYTAVQAPAMTAVSLRYLGLTVVNNTAGAWWALSPDQTRPLLLP